jgi:hypothetical protein
VTHLGDKKLPMHPAMSRQLEEEERRKKYPMCTRLNAHAKDRRQIMDFLDWLRTEKGVTLCTSTGKSWNGYESLGTSDESLAHQYLEIDEKALEAERRQMLEELQESAG